ncbi:MAG TPA: FprA family A-type flavoprotein [Candidatus Gastranaerophilaceae bacterium]|nr:FprA family A-type flavoprotein [Candidatus Gastranaerophilaceae bacterium]
MTFKEIKNNIFYCGLNHRERKMFDELIPLPQGTTYNSYLIKGSEKTVLIDTMYPPKADEFIQNLANNGIVKIDYIVAQHGEQDHSGALPKLLKIYPEAKILTNPKCKEIIQAMLHIKDEKIQTVEDGEEISIGDKTLKFIHAPWVHWPDTMFTYIKEDKIMFTCDFLGAHLPFENLYAQETCETLKSAKRYYAEIMMPFRKFCQKYVQKLKEFDIEMILTSHGPIYKNPDFILKAYEEWTSDDCKNKVLIPYVSMYESTKEMVNYLSEKLSEKGIETLPFDVVNEDLGELAMELVDACTAVFGSSMVLAGPHPAAVTAAYLAGILRPKMKYVSFIGSYGWGGVLTQKLEDALSTVKCEKLEPVIIKGKPKQEDFNLLDRLADEIYQKHKILGLV